MCRGHVGQLRAVLLQRQQPALRRLLPGAGPRCRPARERALTPAALPRAARRAAPRGPRVVAAGVVQRQVLDDVAWEDGLEDLVLVLQQLRQLRAGVHL